VDLQLIFTGHATAANTCSFPLAYVIGKIDQHDFISDTMTRHADLKYSVPQHEKKIIVRYFDKLKKSIRFANNNL